MYPPTTFATIQRFMDALSDDKAVNGFPGNDLRWHYEYTKKPNGVLVSAVYRCEVLESLPPYLPQSGAIENGILPGFAIWDRMHKL